MMLKVDYQHPWNRYEVVKDLLVWLLTHVIVNTNNVLRVTVLVIFANSWHVKQVLNKETKQDQITINFDSSVGSLIGFNSSSSEEFEISSSDYNISSSRTKLSLCSCSISEETLSSKFDMLLALSLSCD